MRPGPKPSLDERRFRPSTPEEAEQLFVALVNTGTGVTLARNILRRLEECDEEGKRDSSQMVTLSRDRKRLAAVGTPPWERPGPRPKLRLSVLMGGAASTGAIGGQFNWLGVAA